MLRLLPGISFLLISFPSGLLLFVYVGWLVGWLVNSGRTTSDDISQYTCNTHRLIPKPVGLPKSDTCKTHRLMPKPVGLPKSDLPTRSKHRLDNVGKSHSRSVGGLMIDVDYLMEEEKVFLVLIARKRSI